MLKSDTGRVGVQAEVWVGSHPVQIFLEGQLQKRASLPQPILLPTLHVHMLQAMTGHVGYRKHQPILVVILFGVCQISIWFCQPVFLVRTGRPSAPPHCQNCNSDGFSAGWPPKEGWRMTILIGTLFFQYNAEFEPAEKWLLIVRNIRLLQRASCLGLSPCW